MAKAIVLLKAGTVLELMKASMGYTDNVKRCHSCAHFVPDNISGHRDALPSHCTLNPALPFPVQKDALCDYHTLLPTPEPPLAMGELLPKGELPSLSYDGVFCSSEEQK